MLKLYRASPMGGDPSFWEKEWSQLSLDKALARVEKDPVYPYFLRYLSREYPNLEGGCGLAQWVTYWEREGYAMVGLDFASETLSRVKSQHNNSPLVKGNICRLPFPDRTFGFYYSGGVVEHFEGGPEPSLREARRVLRDDGVLLISVPYLSPLRSWRYGRAVVGSLSSLEWEWVGGHRVDSPVGIKGSFYQYVYSESVFRGLLTEAGFEVIGSHGVSILHGLLFEDMLPRLLSGQTRGSDEPDAVNEPRQARPRRRLVDGAKALAKRFLVSEDASGMLAPAAPALGLCRFLFANMRLYICKPWPFG